MKPGHTNSEIIREGGFEAEWVVLMSGTGWDWERKFGPTAAAQVLEVLPWPPPPPPPVERGGPFLVHLCPPTLTIPILAFPTPSWSCLSAFLPAINFCIPCARLGISYSVFVEWLSEWRRHKRTCEGEKQAHKGSEGKWASRLIWAGWVRAVFLNMRAHEN